ncbi:galactose oxidase-like domain-containing protein [Streptomyces sp. NPDC050416]|uniref:galactose oxidase-like domain-containing protein n=1 Tax=Streptomyces sp. NPDC050416 TaxID=3365611 RepID=UPI0037A476D2
MGSGGICLLTSVFIAAVSLALFWMAAFTLWWQMHAWRSPALSDDEGTYLAQAWSVQQGDGLAHYTYWYDHPPLGWIQIAVLTWIPALISPESMTVGTMRATMLVISGISAVLVYVLGRRLALPRWAAALGMVFFGLSPLAVVLQREIFLDNLAVMWTLLAFTLAASPSRPVPQTGNQGKMYVSAVLLPDGKVLETGGALHNRANPVYETSVFDPESETFDPVAVDPEARGYHSCAFLLPDGRVMTTGDNPGNGSWNHDVSVYSPPYLFKGPRPAITSVIDTEWNYGDTQRITVDRPIAKAELIRPAAVTHSSDPNQRLVDLPLSVDGNNVDLNVTSNPNLAPPGWYVLFAVDANGVPSVAKWVHLKGPQALEATDASAHVHDFADAPEGKVAGPGKKRTSQKVSPTISGCDRHYGSVNVCVPTGFPTEVKKTTASRCAWLKANDYGRLKVNGRDDPLGLDRDGDGIACGKKDVARR